MIKKEDPDIRYIEIHMPKSDYQMLFDSAHLLVSLEIDINMDDWYVFGEYRKKTTEAISFLYKQIRILKQKGYDEIQSNKTTSKKGI